jgi:hypothetical protein
MKTFTKFIFIIVLTIYSCGKSDKNLPNNKVSDTNSVLPKDTIKPNSRLGDTISSGFIPYTDNPIYLKGNKLYFDSLVPFFKYKDIERLDKLCATFDTTSFADLKELVFSSREISTSTMKDTVYLADYQFLIGNLKTKPGKPKVFIVIGYHEDWGDYIYLISTDRKSNIMDAICFCGGGGDGGDYDRNRITYKNRLTYYCEGERGYQTYSEPYDTLTYTITKSITTLNDDGIFNDSILKIDSNVVKVKKGYFER